MIDQFSPTSRTRAAVARWPTSRAARGPRNGRNGRRDGPYRGRSDENLARGIIICAHYNKKPARSSLP